MIQRLTIIGGIDKTGSPEPIEKIEVSMGDVISVVGSTGSGKTTLIEDIELYACRNTPSNRTVLINGQTPDRDLFAGPSDHPIALITQHTNFLSDMQVEKFLLTHSSVRGSGDDRAIMEETLDFANQLTGEPIDRRSSMTELSGGQTRALLIADAVIIGNSPIILLDEIENAGIHRTKALDLLRRYEKIFIFVTHDPRIALLSDFRIIMKNGGMQKLIVTGEEEKAVVEEIKKIDDLLLDFRAHIRDGEVLTEQLLNDKLRKLDYLN